MVAPLLIAGAAEAGAALAGGLFSQKHNRKIARQQMAFQREFAQHGIRWRAEDAKAAGLHPLFAMGAQIPSSIPIAFEDSMGPALAQAGQSVSRAIAAKMTPEERRAQDMNIELLKSNIRSNDAMAAYYNSLAMRSYAEGTASKAMAEFGMDSALPEGLLGQTLATEKSPVRAGEFIFQAPSVPQASTKDASIAAGPARPSWMEVDMGWGKMVLPMDPSGSVTESMEALGEDFGLKLQVISENVDRYGWGWLYDYLGSMTPGHAFEDVGHETSNFGSLGPGAEAIKMLVRWLRSRSSGPARERDMDSRFLAR